jgi:predicted O-linked N-acetylglucosamine transferase (SPINDLY family)
MVFARKPALIQISYLGYPDSTGVETMDYRIVDRYVEPEPTADVRSFSTEKLLRMPDSYFCYSPPEVELPINAPPVLGNHYITFGSFNNLCKLNDRVLHLWAQVLLAVSDSKLLLKAQSFNDADTRHRIQNCFAQWDIHPDRLILMEKIPAVQSHLLQYHQIDIGLDTFPYNGATTTCEALWMGVPIVTLVGKTHIARVGLSLLSTVGLQDLMTDSAEGYVATCVKLSQDRQRLEALRASMRDRLKTSPLLDGDKFTRHLENHYRTVWQQWCAQPENH